MRVRRRDATNDKGLRAGLRGSYPLIRLLDIAPLGIAESAEEIVTANIRDVAAMEKAMASIDCAVHLAGASVESPCEKSSPVRITPWAFLACMNPAPSRGRPQLLSSTARKCVREDVGDTWSL